MPRLVPLLVLLGIATGCTTTRGAWTAVGVGAGIAVGGVATALAIEAAHPAHACCPPSLFLAVSSLAIGGALALGGLVNVVVLEASD